MKCYTCNAKVNVAWRKYMLAKDRRYKDAFRDVCDPCYQKIKTGISAVTPMPAQQTTHTHGRI